MEEGRREIFQRRGFWWRTMGFTKCHWIGVSVTSTVLCTIGFVCMAGAAALAIKAEDLQAGVPLLLVAVCLFLIEIAALLSSVLSLLFYAGSRLELLVPESNADSAPSPAGDRAQEPRQQ